MAQLTELEQKHAFAEAWLRHPKDPFAAARDVFGADTGRALIVAQTWTLDVEVLAHQQRLIDEHGARSFLPTKEEFARRVLDATDALNDSVLAFEDKLKGYKLFAEIMGYIEKPGPTINNNPTTINRVMVVKDHGSNDDWERRARNQQAALVAGNETKH